MTLCVTTTLWIPMAYLLFLHGYLYTWNRYKFIKDITIDEKKNKYTLQGMIMIIW